MHPFVFKLLSVFLNDGIAQLSVRLRVRCSPPLCGVSVLWLVCGALMHVQRKSLFT